jgi:hypothetical protein
MLDYLSLRYSARLLILSNLYVTNTHFLSSTPTRPWQQTTNVTLRDSTVLNVRMAKSVLHPGAALAQRLRHPHHLDHFHHTTPRDPTPRDPTPEAFGTPSPRQHCKRPRVDDKVYDSEASGIRIGTSTSSSSNSISCSRGGFDEYSPRRDDTDTDADTNNDDDEDNDQADDNTDIGSVRGSGSGSGSAAGVAARSWAGGEHIK